MPMPTVHIILLLFVVIALSSCNKIETQREKVIPQPFEHADFSDITPMSDGSAYALSTDSRIWYMRGSKAIPVSAKDNTSQELPKFDQITPVLDGSAYATCLDGSSGLWHLIADHAEKVVEVSTITQAGASPQISGKAFFALYASEREKRLHAEYLTNNPADTSSGSIDDGSPDN